MSYDIYCVMHGNQRTENWHGRCPVCAPVDAVLSEALGELTDAERAAFDPIVRPEHYNKDEQIECIDAMVAAYGPEAVKTYCIVNAFKYIWRFHNKGGNEDLKKAIWYLRFATGDDPRSYR